MRAIFVDSSFWIALRARGEPEHETARRTAVELARERVVLRSTVFVFGEVHAFFSRAPLLRQQIIRDFWDSPVFRLEEANHADQQEALKILREHEDKEYSFCDALSFVLMRRLGLKRVASFDDHFRQIGEFEVIPDT